MVTTVALLPSAFVLFGMFAPETITVNVPGVDWG